jgi:uncharacterized protein
MPVQVNLRHLDEHSARLDGEIPVAELDIDTRDAVLQVHQPLKYDLEVERLEQTLLVRGRLSLELDCQCVRCLKNFKTKVQLRDWTLHIPLVGEEAAPVVNDCVDLTPFLREDMLLEFPQHPLCDQECRGLPKIYLGQPGKTSDFDQQVQVHSTAWDELDKLKLKE